MWVNCCQSVAQVLFDRLYGQKYIDFYQQYNILYRLNIITPHFHIYVKKYNVEGKGYEQYTSVSVPLFQPHHITKIHSHFIPFSIALQISFRHSFRNPHWRLLRFDYIGKTFDALKCRLLFCYDYTHCHLYYPVVFHFQPLVYGVCVCIYASGCVLRYLFFVDTSG